VPEHLFGQPLRFGLGEARAVGQANVLLVEVDRASVPDLFAVDPYPLCHEVPPLSAIGITWITRYSCGRTTATTSSPRPRSSGPIHRRPALPSAVVMALGSTVLMT
jgi:hypothetical protein